jgi:PAT family acetyl-CoA transporter-like MFS transporter 1
MGKTAEGSDLHRRQPSAAASSSTSTSSAAASATNTSARAKADSSSTGLLSDETSNMLDIDVDKVKDGKMKITSSTSSSFPVEETWNILLLLVLYTLQGIPMGLSASLPLILKEKGATYSDLSLFTMVSLPFSLKLFWAPIVDSIYISAVGRRKTWLIPSQVITGIVMILGSQYVNVWMNHGIPSESLSSGIDIMQLTMYFSGLYFLMATQDIAVDGWALTILSREHVTYASICNSIGQSFGVFIANQSYIALSDPVWCQRFLGASGAVVSLADFMIFWGWVFIITTIAVCLLKTEGKPDGTHLASEPEGLVDTFHHTIAVIKIKSVQTLCLLLLTVRVAFAATDSVYVFRLQEVGVSKADIAAMSTVLVFVGFVVPAVLSKHLNARPFEVMIYSFVAKLVTSLLRWLVLYSLQLEAPGTLATLSMAHYASLMAVLVVHEVASTGIFISFMSFFARIADPSIGGTYMTLLNTITNLGGMWPRPLALWLLPKLSTYECMNANHESIDFAEHGNFCSRCEAVGGKCKF